MTNHHVLGNPSIARASFVEFDYQVGLSGAVLPTTTFAFDPDEFFLADEDLDYAVVAVRATGNEGEPLSAFGWNLIQHPNGETNQLGLRENQLLDVLDDFLHYETDTAPGSSGSPVFNDLWEVVGLHHSGVWATNNAGQPLAIDGEVWREDMGEHRIRWAPTKDFQLERRRGAPFGSIVSRYSRNTQS
jgi:endonuclease G, mitochondrial